MKFIKNILNPALPNAKRYALYPEYIVKQGHEAMGKWWQQRLDWVAANHVGLPQATPSYTQERLIQLGFIGIYSKDDEFSS